MVCTEQWVLRLQVALVDMIHERIQRGGGAGGPDPPPEKSQNIGFLSNSGPDPLNIIIQRWVIISTPAKRQVIISKNIFLSLKVDFVLANTAEPAESRLILSVSSLYAIVPV